MLNQEDRSSRRPAIEERQLQLAVVAQLHQDGPQAFLQQHLRPLPAQGMHRVS